jgi:hypothetical protein
MTLLTAGARAGSPDTYRLEIDTDGTQRVTSRYGALSWRLPDASHTEDDNDQRP